MFRIKGRAKTEKEKSKVSQKTFINAALFSILLTSCSVFGGESSEPPNTIISNGEVFEIPDLSGDDTLVWIHNQNISSFNADHIDNQINDSARWFQNGLLEGLFGVTSKLTYYPELLASEPQVNLTEAADAGSTMVVNYQLRPNLQWSDGTELTSNDVKYTFDIITEGCTRFEDGSIKDGTNEGCIFNMANRIGYEFISNFTVISDTQFSVTFAEVYPDYKSLFSNVFASHTFGANATEVNENLENYSIGNNALPSSGSVKFKSWTKGQKIVFERNDNYHGSQNPDLTNKGTPSIKTIEVLLAENQAQIATIEAKSAHMIYTDLDATYLSLTENSDINIKSATTGVFEHLGMDLSNPHLNKPLVRQAIAFAVDKNQIVQDSYKPLLGEQIAPLGNSYILNYQQGYEDHQNDFTTGQADQARNLLIEAGYSLNSDQIMEDSDGNELRLVFMTEQGNDFRTSQQQLIVEQLRLAGIAINVINVPGTELFASSGRGPFAGNEIWDLVIFSWRGGPWSGAQSSAYGGGDLENSANNIYGYSNTEFDENAAKCNQLVDLESQLSCYNQLDKYTTSLEVSTDGLFIIPIAERRAFGAYRNDLLKTIPDSLGSAAGGPLVYIPDFELS